MYTIPFEWDVINSDNWMAAAGSVDYSVMETEEGQMYLEMLRMAIKDYQLHVKGNKKALEAGEYHSTTDAGKYIRNVKWWLFEEATDNWFHSPLPFETVCEFLGFNPDVVRESIQRMAREKFTTSNQIHRKTNTVKREVATRARNELNSEEGGNNNACRTITGKT